MMDGLAGFYDRQNSYKKGMITFSVHGDGADDIRTSFWGMFDDLHEASMGDKAYGLVCKTVYDTDKKDTLETTILFETELEIQQIRGRIRDFATSSINDSDYRITKAKTNNFFAFAISLDNTIMDDILYYK